MRKILLQYAAVILLMCTPNLFSQEVLFSTDTSVSYNFSSPVDSIPFWHTQKNILDSIDLHQAVMVSQWDQDSAYWEPYFTDSLVFDKSGHHRTEYVKNWDRENGDWFPEDKVENHYLDSLANITMMKPEIFVSLKDPGQTTVPMYIRYI
jgi:hypothetical protein